MEVESEQIDG